MSNADSGVAARPAPKWATWFLALAIPAALLAACTSLVAAAAVFPLFDMTPAVVLVVVFASRRWEGTAKRLMVASGVLAVLAVVQWLVWDLWFVYGLFGSSTYGFEQTVSDLVTTLTPVYLVELGVLLALFASAVGMTMVEVKRVALRSPSACGIGL